MAVKVQLNSAGIVQLLKSPEVIADLTKRAIAIQSAAGEGYDYDISIGGKRARAYVFPTTGKASRDNAKNHTLMRAMDAGRH